MAKTLADALTASGIVKKKLSKCGCDLRGDGFHRRECPVRQARLKASQAKRVKPRRPIGWIVGQNALDVALLAGVTVRSLAYRHGQSPELAPEALRYSPDDAYIDLDRLEWWDNMRVVWTLIGAHYFHNYKRGYHE